VKKRELEQRILERSIVLIARGEYLGGRHIEVPSKKKKGFPAWAVGKGAVFQHVERTSARAGKREEKASRKKGDD